MKKIHILTNELSEKPTMDELDVLVQAEAVREALLSLGYDTSTGTMGSDLKRARNSILKAEADIVFNLVESIDNIAELIHLAPSLLRSMGIPFTGSGPEAMILTSNKIFAKKIMKWNSIPTPGWFTVNESWRGESSHTYIAKPLYEDASVGIDDSSLFSGNNPVKLIEYGLKYGASFFAEEFIPGREFNISVLAGDSGPVVLPPAEIIFRDYPESKPAIVGYKAKWDESSFEYNNTLRSFDFPEEDNDLIEELRRISSMCWTVFDLRGYARIDFRVDKPGNPYVLEVNANPCLSPDSGFFAAVEKAGWNFTDAIQRILNDC
ncbi:MAG: ATP-grasp domain-containing protein [Marinilabiliaceae bacterium]|jgi:D-alanine-D-alanine ligase|nr:ATP-grasp domain-containing protein [Marinilabiliaceae bacterium]